MLRVVSVSLLLSAALLAGCGSEADLAPAKRSAPRGRVVEPQVIQRADPDLTQDDAETLWATPGTVRAVVRVVVSREGVASNPRIVSAEPKDLPIAQAFAAAVVRSLPNWKFRPATLNGQPVEAELNLTAEAEGGTETPQAP